MITHLQEGQLDRNFQARVWHRIFRSQNVQLWKFSSLEWFGNDQLLLLCISGRFSQRCFHVNPLIYGQQLPYDKFGHQAVPHLGLPEAWQREWHIQKPPSIASYIAHQEIVTTCWECNKHHSCCRWLPNELIPMIKDAWNVPILGDPFAFFLDRCK